jgi:putative protease
MEEEVGRITHYFTRLNVGVIEITKGELKLGETIHIKGHTTDLYQKVESLQIEHKSVSSVKKGESAGLGTKEHVREGDIVYRVTED